MTQGLLAVFIVLIVILGAILTRRCTEFLFVGSLLGAIVLYGTDMPMEYVSLLQEVVGEPDHVWLWLVCGLFGSLIAVLQASKGTFGFQKIMSKICNSERKTMLASFVLGVLIFVDDYLNVLTVGVCMKGLYDKRKLPRESLAFVLNSTGAPVCVLLPFSTWAVFYSNLFYNQPYIAENFSSGISAYIKAIPYCFYPFIALIFVLLFCLGIMPKVGPMKKAYQRLAERANAITLGNPLDNPDMGPVVSESHMNDVLAHISSGIEQGARLVCGGERYTEGECAKGYFIRPTVFADCTDDMTIVKEEIFGPVVTVQTFKTEEEAIEMANNTEYGLAGGVYTKDGSRALRVIKELRAGITWINCYNPCFNEAPWGGYKKSGIGRELGVHGLEEYQEIKQININLNPGIVGWYEH